jgi:hypothetical protein
VQSQSHQARIAGELLDDRVAHQMPRAGTAPLESLLLERSSNVDNFVSIQDGRHNLEAVGERFILVG